MWFPAQLSELYRILDYIRSHAKHAGLGPTELHRLELVSEEAVVNVMHHAFPHQTGVIEVACEVHPHRFDLILKDHGIPFNPTECTFDPETIKHVSDPPIGGVGLCLIHRLIDEVSYTRNGDENILRLGIRYIPNR